MPSDTFLRLNDEKKKKLIDASFKEFSLNNFNDASINRIIKEAGISRGSFYMYFIDKKDLYFYLLEQYGEILVNNMKRDLIKNKGDLFKMFQDNIKESCMTDDDSIRDTKSLFGTNVCKYDPPTPRTYPPEGCPALETPTHKTLRIRVIHTLSSAFVLDAI